MAIFSRISDILKANINDMLDKAEDPEKMVKQIIIEMEEQVDSATQALGQAMGSQKVAEKQLSAAKQQSASWEERAKTALKSGDEDLARRALNNKVTTDEQIASLQKSYDEMSAQVDKLKDQVRVLKEKLEEARSRQSVLIARSKMADATKAVATSVGSTNTASAFSKLDKLEAKVDQKEATAQAYTELNEADAATTNEFKELDHSSAVDSELERLKNELGM
jgi:phage shock protein A